MCNFPVLEPVSRRSPFRCVLGPGSGLLSAIAYAKGLAPPTTSLARSPVVSPPAVRGSIKSVWAPTTAVTTTHRFLNP